MDTEWFQKRIAMSPLREQKELAARMKNRHGVPYDKATVTRLLKGEQALLATDAVQLARLLGVPLRDVLHRAGIDLSGIEMGGRR